MNEDQGKWLAGVQRALNKPGAGGLGFYTVGDADIVVYDRAKQQKIDEIMDSSNRDFCQAVEAADAHIGKLDFPQNVHSTAA